MGEYEASLECGGSAAADTVDCLATNEPCKLAAHFRKTLENAAANFSAIGCVWSG
jgi:hypothetical protein